MTAKIQIERSPRGYVDRYRSYEVIVNGELRAKIRRGEKRTIAVDPGELEIYVKIDWCRSRIVQMELDQGSEVRLLCRSRSMFTVLYGVTVGRNDYVRLEQARTPPPPPGEIDEPRRRMLQGKALVSRWVWVTGQLAYVVVLILALVALFAFADGIWLTIGLTILAFAAGMLPELFIDLRYSNYRKEWELANRREADPTKLHRSPE